jgi:hypothetical protein
MSEEYAVLLKKGEWLKKRVEVLERDGYKCRDCREEDNLQVHHCWYAKGAPWETPNEFLMTLCENCHERRQKCENELKRGLGLLFTRIPPELLEYALKRRTRAGEHPFQDWGQLLYEEWLEGCARYTTKEDYDEWKAHFDTWFDHRDLVVGVRPNTETPREALQREGRGYLRFFFNNMADDNLSDFVSSMKSVYAANDIPVFFGHDEFFGPFSGRLELEKEIERLKAELAKAVAGQPIQAGVS